MSRSIHLYLGLLFSTFLAANALANFNDITQIAPVAEQNRDSFLSRRSLLSESSKPPDDLGISEKQNSIHNSHFNPNNDSSCRSWSNPGALFPSEVTTFNHSVYKDLLVTEWLHSREGFFHMVRNNTALALQCLSKVSGANSDQFSQLEKTDKKIINKYPQVFGIDLLECNSSQTYNIQTHLKTVVISAKDIIEYLPIDRHAANLWHFHTANFNLWVSLFFPKIFAYAQTLNEFKETSETLLRTPTHVVVLAGSQMCKFGKFPKPLFEVTPENIEYASKHGASRAYLEGLEAVNDWMGHMVVACEESVNSIEIQNELKRLNYPKIGSIVVPPLDELLSDIAIDPMISKTLTDQNCFNSLIQKYSHDFMTGRGRLSLSGDYRRFDEKHLENESGEFKEPLEDKNRVARHVCLISRQNRQRIGMPKLDPNRDFDLRNLEADFFHKLMVRLGSTIVLSPGLSLRNKNSTITPLHLDKVSIPGQLRFVHEECAVIIGVHGAGLANLLGLRRGTAVIELIEKKRSYDYFRNLAVLLDDTSYDKFSVISDHRLPNMRENDLYVEDSRFEELVTLVKRRLDESLKIQRRWAIRLQRP